jgi:hypothetical protein
VQLTDTFRAVDQTNRRTPVRSVREMIEEILALVRARTQTGPGEMLLRLPARPIKKAADTRTVGRSSDAHILQLIKDLGDLVDEGPSLESR